MNTPPIVLVDVGQTRRRSNSRAGYVESETGCWIWQGNKSKKDGYGQIRHPAIGKKVYVHRLLYERIVGPIPDGMVLDHYRCDTPACCNPWHVRPVSPRENVLRGETIAAGHAARSRCPRGHVLAGTNLRRSAEEPSVRRCRECKNLLRRLSRAALRNEAR